MRVNEPFVIFGLKSKKLSWSNNFHYNSYATKEFSQWFSELSYENISLKYLDRRTLTVIKEINSWDRIHKFIVVHNFVICSRLNVGNNAASIFLVTKVYHSMVE